VNELATPGIGVVVVSGVRLYCDGLTAALDAAPDVRVVAAISDPRIAASTIGRVAADVDVLLLDVSVSADRDVSRALVRAIDPTPVVALAISATDSEIVSWAECGVSGLVTAEAAFDDLLAAVRAAGRGESSCTARAASALVRRVMAVAQPPSEGASHALTRREREIADLLVLGLTNKQIAARLFLGQSTVKNHVHSLLGKLGARTRSEAVARILN
jgi:two-component system, NarL family, nitrate/nitrite response regulator NarL